MKVSEINRLKRSSVEKQNNKLAVLEKNEIFTILQILPEKSQKSVHFR